MSDTFRTINGLPFFWKDKEHFVHACEGANVHPGIRLIWTLCDRDVPENSAFIPESGDMVTCATCLVRLSPNDGGKP